MSTKPKSNFIVNYFTSSIEELKKVTWPKRNEVLRLTLMVVVSVSIATVAVLGIDYLLTTFIKWVLK